MNRGSFMPPRSARSEAAPPAPRRTLLGTAICVGLAAWCSCGTIGLVGDNAARIGVLPSWWLLPIFVAAVWALGTILRLSSSQLTPLWASAIVLLPWLPFPVPASFLLWTGAFTIPVWMFAVAGALLAGPLPRLSWWRSSRSPVAAAALALALYGASAR